MSVKHAAPASSQLSRERAVVLQKSLLEGYTAANFQKALAELERSQGALSCAFAAGRRALVRQVQAEVLPWHGYEASDEGARQMVVDFDQFRGDAVIQELSFQIDAALRCDSRGGLARSTVVTLLQSMLDAFSTKEFQDRIQELHLASNVSPEDDGFYLEGRAEAALDEERFILPKFGLAPSRQGVLAMLSEVAKFVNCPEVVRLLDEINTKLGMKPPACLRFRERLLSRWSSEDLSQTQGEATAESDEDELLVRLSKVFEAGDAADTELLGVPTPPITKARAIALFADLLMEFSSHSFQTKFQAVLNAPQEKVEADGQGQPGRRDLVYKVYREVLPTYGFSADPPGLARLVQALHPHMEDVALLEKFQALEGKLHLPEKNIKNSNNNDSKKKGTAAAISPSGNAPQPRVELPRETVRPKAAAEASPATAGHLASSHRTTPSHSKAQILNLLSTMIERYESPAFQRRLAAVRCGDSPHQVLKRMVRAVQVDVLPSFGFGANEEGMKEMSVAIAAFQDDREVTALAACLDAALTGSPRPAQAAAVGQSGAKKAVVLAQTQVPSSSSSSSSLTTHSQWSPTGEQRASQEADNAAEGGHAGKQTPPITRARANALFSDLLLEFSSHGFQTKFQGNRTAVVPRDAGRQQATAEATATGYPTSAPRTTPSHSKAQILDLLSTMIASYESPAFQRRLAAVRSGESPHQVLKRMVRAVQVDVLPSFGFAANEQGMKEMSEAIGAFREDREVTALAACLDAALTGSARPAVGQGAPIRTRGAAVAPQGQAASLSSSPSPAQSQSTRAGAQGTPSGEAFSRCKLLALLRKLSAEVGLEGKRGAKDQHPHPHHQSAEDEGLHATGGELPKAVRDTILLEVLPRYGFPATDQGLRAVLEAVQQLHNTETAADSQHHHHRSSVGCGQQRGQPKMKLDHPITIPLEKAGRLHDELLRAFSAPLFQKRLSELYRKHSSDSLEFADLFGSLVSTSMEGPLVCAGLSPAPEDLGDLFLSLSNFFASDDAETVLASIDEALFSCERPGQTGLGLGTVVRVWREQLAAFGRSSFQQALMELKAQASELEKESGFFHLTGRAELALTVQKEVLSANCLGATPRDLQKLLAVTATLTRVPLVAGLLDAVNAKLGMDVAARHRFRTRMGVLIEG
mmetsp:Transcript_89938/g.196847  ORF Transcript_89938/g.196847 Transcript_89938/m.196847 type:complete len:1153 (-) Transcript_89938:316-3774(-)